MSRGRNTALITAGVALLVLGLRFLQYRDQEAGYPALRFCGGAREVGGSCCLLETEGADLVVDCGAMSDAGADILPPDPEKISFMLLTHAHSDHCGLIPELFREGFTGRVYCAFPTDRIVPRMLRMARSFKRERVPDDIFDRAVGNITGMPFGEWKRVENISFRFRRAEHLLGAAFIEVLIHSEEDTARVVFSGDLGAGNSVLLRPLEKCPRADYLIMESTYGGRIRETDARDGHDEFARNVADCLKDGGDVLIPAFTLGRTQEIIAVLELYRREGVIPANTRFYSDSPTARDISDIYRRNRSELSSMAAGQNLLETAALLEVKSSSSLAVHSRHHIPSVFISSSGDMEHANSPRHLMRMFDAPKNLLCIVGWQPPGTLGRKLRDGEDPVLVGYSEHGKWHRKWIRPELQVREYHSFSGHADQRGLLAWLEGTEGIRKLFLVHGDYDQATALKSRIDGINVVIPERGERVVINGN